MRVIACFPESFRIVALAGGRNVKRLAEQVRAGRPQLVSCQDEASVLELRDLLRHQSYPVGSLRFVHGGEGNEEVACHPQASLVLSAISGAAGLIPTYRALEAGKTVALANKETLVVAGELMLEKARERGTEILPVDSEHNAIHQCLRGAERSEVRRLILTASGGPFRETPAQSLASVTPQEALNHPTWSMGRKITIDSATLMNKGLEVIEASHLFGMKPEEIEVAVHPQSIVHSLVEFIDGSVLAQLGPTDMRIAIQYALTYPERWQGPLPSLDIRKISKLEFYEPDRDKFPCLGLAYQALRGGGTLPAVLNAANEIAVEAFLAHRISFAEIPRIIAAVLAEHRKGEAATLKDVLDADSWARGESEKMAQRIHVKAD